MLICVCGHIPYNLQHHSDEGEIQKSAEGGRPPPPGDFEVGPGDPHRTPQTKVNFFRSTKGAER